MYGEQGQHYKSHLSKNFDGLEFPNFSSAPFRYLQTKDLSRLLFYNHLYNLIFSNQGDIHLLGAAEGNTMFILAHLAEIFEPLNTCRRIVAFDNFNTTSESYSSISQADGQYYNNNPMPCCVDYPRLSNDVTHFNNNTRIYPEERIILIPGDASITYPKYIETHAPLISLLLLHIEVYTTEKLILESAWPCMPKSSIVASSTLGYGKSPGVTRCVSDVLGFDDIDVKRTGFTSKMSYFIK